MAEKNENCVIILWLDDGGLLNSTCKTCQGEEESLGTWSLPVTEGEVMRVSMDHMLTVLRDKARAEREDSSGCEDKPKTSKVCNSLAFRNTTEHRCIRTEHPDTEPCHDLTHKWMRGRHPRVYALYEEMP